MTLTISFLLSTILRSQPRPVPFWKALRWVYPGPSENSVTSRPGTWCLPISHMLSNSRLRDFAKSNLSSPLGTFLPLGGGIWESGCETPRGGRCKLPASGLGPSILPCTPPRSMMGIGKWDEGVSPEAADLRPHQQQAADLRLHRRQDLLRTELQIARTRPARGVPSSRTAPPFSPGICPRPSQRG